MIDFAWTPAQWARMFAALISSDLDGSHKQIGTGDFSPTNIVLVPLGDYRDSDFAEEWIAIDESDGAVWIRHASIRHAATTQCGFQTLSQLEAIRDACTRAIGKHATRT